LKSSRFSDSISSSNGGLMLNKRLVFSKELDRLRRSREEMQTYDAIAEFTKLEVSAAAALRFDDWADAAAERIICYQHAYEQTGDEQYRLTMFSVAQFCEEFATTHRVGRGRIQIFQYRQGVAEYIGGEYTRALKHFRRACVDLYPTDTKYSEFTGYLGSALLLAKKDRSGLELLDAAIDMILTETRLPLFHRKIIEAGLYMKLARGAHHIRQHKLVKEAMGKAKALSEELAAKFKMKQRLVQYKALAIELRQ
jgi:hypothetical protein